ncbi:hypothetical protein K5M76_15420 [Shewanella xiamenensis]|uniref:hypothetical protein n=1 Tax=Shewanella xiamenensis TaxID=332186 RepID=UPI001CC5FEB8|nr:hypothetical protein [Shewanella xiamenensis]MCT8860298.1 hypothetical protein [Shewanella xiamenensis]UWG63594.1 hypothetical protein K5M76_15420 [Shewanella xiamenensis]BDA59783.1 hypothetical protein NUITMVS1_12460 [Shewanella xiamenensis]
MYWFISALIVASAIFWLVPQKASIDTNNNKLTPHLPMMLLFLPLIVMSWLIFEAVSNGADYTTIAAFGFVATACLIALPKLHRFIMPCALLTALALIAMVLQHL